MVLSHWFTKLMKGEPQNDRKRPGKSWVVDESKCLSMSEIRKLRKTCQKAKVEGILENRFSPIRNWFMIELALSAGLRVEEIASLKHGSILIDESRSSIIVIGKGNKKRSVWISSRFKKICQQFFSYKKQFDFSIHKESSLLNNLNGFRISKRSLQKFFKEASVRAALPTHYSIHNLRHTYATFLLKASNYNYRFVQQQLGHSSIRTTQVYASVLESDGREAIERLYK